MIVEEIRELIKSMSEFLEQLLVACLIIGGWLPYGTDLQDLHLTNRVSGSPRSIYLDRGLIYLMSVDQAKQKLILRFLP